MISASIVRSVCGMRLLALRIRAILAICICAIVVCVCGGSASARSSVRVHAASCPKGGEKSIFRLIPGIGSGQHVVAPAGTLWTTICSGSRTGVLKGGPINAALNSASYRQNEICVTNLVPPILVILRARTLTRRFIMNMDGCPGVVISDVTKLSFTPGGIKRVNAALVKSGLIGPAQMP